MESAGKPSIIDSPEAEDEEQAIYDDLETTTGEFDNSAAEDTDDVSVDNDGEEIRYLTAGIGNGEYLMRTLTNTSLEDLEESAVGDATEVVEQHDVVPTEEPSEEEATIDPPRDYPDVVTFGGSSSAPEETLNDLVLTPAEPPQEPEPSENESDTPDDQGKPVLTTDPLESGSASESEIVGPVMTMSPLGGVGPSILSGNTSVRLFNFAALRVGRAIFGSAVSRVNRQLAEVAAQSRPEHSTENAASNAAASNDSHPVRGRFKFNARFRGVARIRSASGPGNS